MAAFDYGTLTGPKTVPGSIRSWVNYELIDVEGVLLDAQAYICGGLRTREMRASATVTIAEDAVSAALPDGFLDPIKLILPDGSAIGPRDEGELLTLQQRQEDGTLYPGRPAVYAIWDEALQFDVAAEQAFACQFLFFKRPALLSRTAQTNFLTTRYPNLLRAACLMHAADNMHDEAEYARWKARADELIGRANVETDLARRGADYGVSVR